MQISVADFILKGFHQKAISGVYYFIERNEYLRI